MPGGGKNPDRDFCAGYAQPQEDRAELQRLASDPGSWGNVPDYEELATDPSVQLRLGRLIVQCVVKRRRRWC
jgi:hypothetical protein